ncbi:MAG TPA: acyl-CoA dehydrogenase family protein [Acidimicrobiales bacterium]|nr:acyl-CoA dehydrogenase family protein [Acidimicrobiales bacterium]
MRLRFSDEDEAFRTELLAWLDEHPPPFDEMHADPRQSSADQRPWARRWQQTLFDAGYLVPGWPPELGGRNATPAQQMIYFEEFTKRDIPRSANPQGLSIITPSLVDYGSPEQREQFVVPTLRAEISWCLGMSEPNAGSDLASLTTKAVLDGDHFVVNGQKVWTSGAQHADWCFCFVRTDTSVPKHKGISVLIIDMTTPGIEYRPIAELTEPTYADFNEVFFTDVHVPRANLVGDLNDGWRLSMGSLAHERAMLWIDYAYDVGEVLEHLVRMGTERKFDARQRDVVASVFIDHQALQAIGYSGFAKFAKGQAAPEHSILKLFGSEALQRALLAGTEESGIDGIDLDQPAPKLWREGSFSQQYLRSFAATIPGGTSEIQRNIIAERILGLPR